MQEVFEKIIEKLRRYIKNAKSEGDWSYIKPFEMAIGIVKQVAAEYNNGWIPCNKRMPENEKEVEITFMRQHYKTGEVLYLTARAFHEDGTFTTEDSGCGWNETDNWEYCEEKDACIIPEGWYEGGSFTEEFGIVDMPVIAWRYPTEPYQPSICTNTDCPYNEGKECPAAEGCAGRERGE